MRGGIILSPRQLVLVWVLVSWLSFLQFCESSGNGTCLFLVLFSRNCSVAMFGGFIFVTNFATLHHFNVWVRIHGQFR